MHHYQHAKNQLNLSIQSWETGFESPNIKTTLVFDHPDLNIVKTSFSFPEFVSAMSNQNFQSTFHFLEFVQSCISSFCSGDMVDLKILIGQEHFGTISQEPYFSQIYNLCWNIATSINFQYRLNWEKSYIMPKFRKN